jgi:hypothetical protein
MQADHASISKLKKLTLQFVHPQHKNNNKYVEHLISIIKKLADFPSIAPNQMLLRHRQQFLRASY